MIADRPIYRCAHLTLEASSAHGIHSGRGDSTHDVLLVRDGNGLPALPGTSIAGVLRHAFTAQFGKEDAGLLFGQIGEQANLSWLSVGWGYIHNQNNQVVEGIHLISEDDEILSFLRNDKPLVRQRVRLNHRGAAEDKGKFDTTLVPAGARYTSMLGYWCDGSPASEKRWQDLLALIAGKSIRLGHATRSGSGLFQAISFTSQHFDLTTAEGKKAFLARSRSRNQAKGTNIKHVESNNLFVQMQLIAENGWRVGGGEQSLGQHGSADKLPNMLPQHELKIVWSNNKATLSKQLHILPGSALKGALRHRVAYHYRCLAKQFSHTLEGENCEAGECPAVTALFGSSNNDSGTAGILIFEDVFIDKATLKTLMHNRIDRFTGGVINGALFSEETLWKTPITVRIELTQGHRATQIDALSRKAFSMALSDLVRGWLPLGASGSRGLGVFTSAGQTPLWSDDGNWISHKDNQEAA